MKRAMLLLCLCLAIPVLACASFEAGQAAVPFDPVTMDPGFPAEYPPLIEELRLESHGSGMNAILYVAPGVGPHPTVLLLHGFPGNEKNLDLAQALRRAGNNVLFFHYRGSWGSEGDFSLSNALADVHEAMRFLRSDDAREQLRVDGDRLRIIGHSMGGGLTLLAAQQDPEVGCAVSLAAANFSHYIAIARSSPGAALQIGKRFEESAGPIRDFDPSALAADFEVPQLDLVAGASGLAGRPVFVIGASQDEVLDLEPHHGAIVKAFEDAGVDLEAVALPADHSFSAQRIELTRLVLDWVEGACP